MEELHLCIKIHTPSGQAMGDKPLYRVTLLPLPFLCRYNKLLEEVALSLKDLLKALKGLVVMSSRLELMASSLYNNSVPEIWNAKVCAPASPAAARAHPTQRNGLSAAAGLGCLTWTWLLVPGHGGVSCLVQLPVVPSPWALGSSQQLRHKV